MIPQLNLKSQIVLLKILIQHQNGTMKKTYHIYFDGKYKIGDVTFGLEKKGILLLAYTRKNVFVSIKAATEITKEISKRINDKIDEAPEWKDQKDKPSLIFFFED
ncbi:MAG: hypothetical protein U0T82_02650 [Bacteroidales bacterium]